jgi:hypothetical protein
MLSPFVVTTLFLLGGAHASLQKQPPQRPALVTESLAQQKQLYYFGLGSNMLRSKLENRGANQSKIELIEMEPAVVPNHRLAFNMRGFAPLEPGMGSLEPADAGSRPLLAYEKPECHGALVTLTPENYEKVMASEGVGVNQTNPGYEEIVVTAIPYDPSKPPVQAIALRARPHARLSKDPCPSVRYMKILREGAIELNLKPCYQDFLNKHPVQLVPNWLKKIAIRNLIATFTISSTLKWRGPSRLQSRLLFWVYVPSNAHPFLRAVGDLLAAILLLPGAVIGVLIKTYYKVTSKELPPFLHRFIKVLEASETENELAEKPKIQIVASSETENELAEKPKTQIVAS